MNWLKSGAPWVGLTAGAVSLALVAVLGMLLLLGWHGLGYFWPSPVYQLTVIDNHGHQQQLLGEIHDVEQVPVAHLRAQHPRSDAPLVTRYLVKTGNREILHHDFQWLPATTIISRKQPADVAVLERVRNGNFYGYPQALYEKGQMIEGHLHELLPARIERVNRLREQAEQLEQGPIRNINHQREQSRLQLKKWQDNQSVSAAKRASLEKQQQRLLQRYQHYEEQLFALRQAMQRDQLQLRIANGQSITIALADVMNVSFPNAMTTWDKSLAWLQHVGHFVSRPPREANTEGGVFPAIFGTVFMVLLMAVFVTPFGVIAALYLHEYAGNNALTRLIRIAVINLAGVPSIVYGVFGLGFFVYLIGGSIDQWFFSAALPTPTFGTPGILWASLTMAILTLPVVIVSTEEGLARIPRRLRDGSMALGATKAETIWRIVLPAASPAMMTGLILAVARAAGEVAPLMLVGVAKSAQLLPIDGQFPYVHLERKFMHLGFQIYDVGFQSPNVEAARPLVYASALLLVVVIIVLNISAITIRNKLRKRYQVLG